VCHLSVTNNGLSGAGVSRFVGQVWASQKLVSLDFSNRQPNNLNKLGLRGLERLSAYIGDSRVFYRLEVEGCNIGGAGLAVLVGKLGWQSLQVLNASSNQIEDLQPGVLTWMTNAHLEELNLSDNLLRDGVLVRLSKESRRVHMSQRMPMQRLDLSKNRFTSQGGSSLMDCLHHNDFLEALSLSKNCFERVELDDLLQTSNSLRSLNVASCRLEELSIDKIFGPIGNRHSRLVFLNLHDNPLALNAIRIISNAMASNPESLETLLLSHCEIVDEAGAMLAASLHTQKRLACLDLSSNFLGKLSGSAIVNLVHANCLLRKLNLEKNLMDPSTLTQIHKLMRENGLKDKTRTIQHLQNELRVLHSKNLEARPGISAEEKQALLQDIEQLKQQIASIKAARKNEEVNAEYDLQTLKKSLSLLQTDYNRKKTELLYEIKEIEEHILTASKLMRLQKRACP
jgi:hypothetical protein